jgi:hypothetical protein
LFLGRDVKKKSSGLDRRPRFVSRDPAHCGFIPREKFGLLSIVASFSADGGAAVEFERAASERWCFRATMVLSEARGYGYFWLSERA